MKNLLILLIVAVSFIACKKHLKISKLTLCDCLYGYEISESDYLLDDQNVTKKIRRKLMIPEGTSRFWYFCGKNMNFINWAKKLYIYKIGDMDYRIIVINEKVYTISEDDENLNKGLIRDDSIIARWGEDQLSLIFKKTNKREKGFFHEVYFENNTYIGVVTFNSEKIKIINAETELKKYNFIKLNKYNKTFVDYRNKNKRTIRASDCKGMLNH